MSVPSVLQRCAAHPSRPAFDACPVCGLPRCGADAQRGAAGCLSCEGVGVIPSGAALTQLPRARLIGWTRGAVFVLVVGLVGAFVQSEYIGSKYFSVLMPAIVGGACGSVAVFGCRPLRGRLPRLMGVIVAMASAGYSFTYSHTRFGPVGRWLPPVAAAGAASWLWTHPANRGKRGKRSAKEPTLEN